MILRYTLVADDKDINTMANFAEMMNKLKAIAPKDAPYCAHIDGVVSELCELMSYMYLDLQNGEVSSENLTEILNDNFDFEDEEDDDEDADDEYPIK